MDEPVRIRNRPFGRFSDQVVARAEVLVEAAVREAGRLHDLGDAGAFQPLLADAFGRDLDDALVCLGFFFLGRSHLTKSIAIIYIGCCWSSKSKETPNDHPNPV